MARQSEKYFKRSRSEDIWNKNQSNASNNDHQRQLDELLDRICDLEQKISYKDDIINQLNIKNEGFYSEISQLKERIIKLVKEKDEALSRISKLAGEKLMTGNPAITDLGNPNRPAKIGEKWGSLYSDEWTDAYEDIRKQCKEKTEEPEKKLMQITKECYQNCLLKAEKQMNAIKTKLWSVACSIYLLDSQSDTPTNGKPFTDDNGKVYGTITRTMESFIEQVKDLRQKSPVLVEAAKNMCMTEYKQNNPTASTNEMKFVSRCSELCWHMCISNPQMAIEYENFEEKAIDSTKFNPYNRTGNMVEFVVWPVLLLHENGPVLAKGTVQTNNHIIQKSLTDKITTSSKCIDNLTYNQCATDSIKDGKQNTKGDINTTLPFTDTGINSQPKPKTPYNYQHRQGGNYDACGKTMVEMSPTIGGNRTITYNKYVDQFKTKEETNITLLKDRQMSIEHDKKQEGSLQEQSIMMKPNRKHRFSKSYGQVEKIDFNNISVEKSIEATQSKDSLFTERAKKGSNTEYQKHETSSTRHMKNTNMYSKSVNKWHNKH